MQMEYSVHRKSVCDLRGSRDEFTIELTIRDSYRVVSEVVDRVTTYQEAFLLASRLAQEAGANLQESCK